MNVTDSPRLQFELMTRKDSELMFELDQDPEVMQFINDGKLTSRQDIEEVYIPRMESYTNPDEGWGIWKVSLKENNEFIGWILIRPMEFFSDHPQFNNLEIGWRFKRSCWGNGYATEAANNIKRALVDIGKIKTLSAIAIEENCASTNIMLKLGMRFVKKDVHCDPLGDQLVVFYQLDL